MQRFKDEGVDPSKPIFSNEPLVKNLMKEEPDVEISMSKPEVNRMISLDDLRAHNQAHEPWFVVRGEVSHQKHF